MKQEHNDRPDKTEPSHSMVIREFRLSGFQVFDKLTRFPLSDITLLYGPNSSGKSALADAIVLLEEALRVPDHSNPTPSFDVTPMSRFAKLKPHWRRLGRNEFDLSPMLQMGYTASTWVDLEFYVSAAALVSAGELAAVDVSAIEYQAKTIAVDFVYRLDFFDESEPHARRDIHLALDSIPLAALEETTRLGLNLMHPLLEGLRKYFLNALQAIGTTPFVDFSDGWVWLKSEQIILNNDRTINRELFFFMTEFYRDNDIEVSSEVKSLFALIAGIFDEVHLKGLSKYDDGLSTRIVPASRTVPRCTELTFMVTDHLVPVGDFKRLSESRPEGVSEEAIGTYFSLARSAVSEHFSEQEMSLAEKEMITSVNEALRGALFIEHGYQVRPEFHLLVGVDNMGPIRRDKQSGLPQYPIRVYLSLVDTKERRLSFEDVGSGIGYVLPVLCAINTSEPGMAMIQQPELHLHPALQAALGDVLIHAHSDHHVQMLVETHSEHLLLRILRRIRQTERCHAKNMDSALLAEELSVLYFDARPSGFTEVRRLRVSREGDFLDPWPKGFFSERDVELFDE